MKGEAEMSYEDIRPDWVKQVLALRPRLIGWPLADGSWRFEPAKPSEEEEVGAVQWHSSPETGEMRPRIWNGEQWLDLRDEDGRQLHRRIFEKEFQAS